MASSNLGLHRLSPLVHQHIAFLGRPKKLLLKFHTLSTFPAVALPKTVTVFSSDGSGSCCFPLGASNSKLNNRIRSCSTSSFIISNDEKYGNKQIISITPDLYNYILANVREPEILRQLREETAVMRGSQMQVSPDQAQLLAMLVQIHGAERCIEVGVYTGYSSLAVALVLPKSGRLVACERDAKSLEVAKRYYEKAGLSHLVDVKHGLAADVLKLMIMNGEACSYDFAFVDAEKRMYEEYFELLLQLVRIGGLIVIDNVLWHGKVADPMVNDAKTASIRSFNRKIMEDKRVNISMIPIGDGMTICRKVTDYRSQYTS